MHQCLKCKKYYEDDEVPILDGCTCGARIFLFVKQQADVERADKVFTQIEAKIKEIEQEQIEEEKLEGQKDLLTSPEDYETETVPGKYAKARKSVKDEKSKFGIETIKVKDIGIYEINLDALMKGRPVVVLSKGGSYIISLPSVFGKDSEVVLNN
ncbi:MAG: Zn-ribbon containing protein [Candidatus Undinarchaeales archaeon]|jgi:predicted  nucleic acid-binding Zn-ribbon protein|nr:Zn-ribbon containing protein [Candidatus Undinarchaeales archaeon]